MDLLKVLSDVGLLILFINMFLYLIGFARNSKAYKFFVIYLCLLFLIQILTEVYAMLGLNNHFLATYYLFFPFVLLSGFFYNLFSGVNSKKQRLVKYLSSGVLVGLLAQYCIYPNTYFIFNSWGLIVTSCVISLYSVLYLFELLSVKLSFQYVTIGIFIYFISSSLIFALASIIVSFSREMSMFIWKINAGLFIIYQLLILWEWKKIFYLKQTKQE